MNGVQVRAVARGAVLEMLRRRDAAVLGLFAGVWLLFLGAARVAGVESPAAGTFLLNLSLTLTVGLAHGLTLLMAARQVPDELERRTVYPLLARPVTRADVLLGKGLASWGVGLAVLGVLLVPTMALVPRLEAYEGGTLAQLLMLQPVALGMTASMALCFSLWVPRVLAVFLSGVLVFGSGMLGRLPFLAWLSGWLPDPGRLNLVLRYTDGIGPLGAADWVRLAVAGCVWCGVWMVAACHVFSRRSL